MKKIILITFILVIAFEFVSDFNKVSAVTISDPIGDVRIGNPAVAAADIVSFEVIYDANNLYLTTVFAPGTFDINDYRFLLYLDTDQNPGTGANPIGIGSTLRTDIGVDFDLRSDTDDRGGGFGPLGVANIVQWGVGVVNSVPINFGIDSISLSIPLAFIGNDDGAVNYIVEILDSRKDGFAQNYDIAPDSGFETSTGIPEPAVIFLYVTGLVGLVVLKRKILK